MAVFVLVFILATIFGDLSAASYFSAMGGLIFAAICSALYGVSAFRRVDHRKFCGDCGDIDELRHEGAAWTCRGLTLGFRQKEDIVDVA